MNKINPFAVLAGVLGYAAYLLWHILLPKSDVSGYARGACFYLILGFLVLFILRVGAAIKKSPQKALIVFPPALEVGRILRFLHTLLFLTVIFVLKQADLPWADFDRKGLFIIIHLFSRILFSVYFGAACFGAGKIIVEKLSGNGTTGSAAENFILYFFTGATSLALAGVAAGFLGVLNTVFALSLMTPLIFYSAPFVQEPVLLLYRTARRSWDEDRSRFSVNFIFLWILAGSAAVVVLYKGLYPGTSNNDIWEHYLPYYREVLRTGHLGPHALWNHFYVSKAAGLFYLAGVLGDVFSVQLVSLCFAFVLCILLYRSIKSLTGNTHLALTAVIVFLCLYDGDFFKHHTVLGGYIIFLVWVVECSIYGKKPFKIYAGCGALASFYLGFYQPIVFVLMGFFFLTMASWFFLTKQPRTRILFPVMLGIAGLAGMLFVFAINFNVTGLILDAPIRFFWRYGDIEKFLSIIGPSGVAFFTNTNSDLAESPNFFNAIWAMKIFKIEILRFLFPFPVIAAGIFFSGWASFFGTDREKKIAPYFIFILCALVFGQVIQVASIDRLYTFSIFFTLVAILFVAGRFLNSMSGLWKQSVLVLVLLLLSVNVFCQPGDKLYLVRFREVFNYASGRLSLEDVLIETDRFFTWNKIKLPSVIRFRREIGPDERIFNIGYDAAPASSFPGAGLVTEPSYTLGPGAEEMIFGPPGETKRRLKAMGINYFMINFEDCIFSGLGFSGIFDGKNFGRYFRVVSEDQGTYLLTWRQEGEAQNVPWDLIRMFDIKRTGILFYPFSNKLHEDLFPEVEKFFKNGGSVEKGEGLEKILEDVLVKNMVALSEIEDNQVLAGQFVLFVCRQLTRDKGQMLAITKARGANSKDSWSEEVSRSIVWYVRTNEAVFYRMRFGSVFVNNIFNQQRIFQEIYRSRKDFRALLKLKEA